MIYYLDYDLLLFVIKVLLYALYFKAIVCIDACYSSLW